MNERLPGLQGSVCDWTPHAAVHTRSLWQHLAFVHLKRQSRFNHRSAARHLEQYRHVTLTTILALFKLAEIVNKRRKCRKKRILNFQNKITRTLISLEQERQAMSDLNKPK